MSLPRSLVAWTLAALLAGAPVAAMADSAPVTVKVNMARILRINSPAATVIVGNPGVADVTIQDPQTLILTGKSYGQTNLIVLDSSGSPVADTTVEVVQDQADLVTVYMGDRRTSLACSPQCQPTIMIGDDTGYTSDTAASAKTVAGAAN